MRKGAESEALRGPAEAAETYPQQLLSVLRDAKSAPLNLRELSGVLALQEKAIPDLLRKVEHQLSRSHERLQQLPPRCRGCGFRFEERGRAAKPGRCPQCRATRIEAARFWVG